MRSYVGRGNQNILGWGNVRKLYGLIIQGSWEGRRSEFAGVGRWCRMWTAVCVMHQQFTSLSQLRCLCQGLRSWNPTSTRSIAARQRIPLSLSLDIRPIPETRFYTILHVNHRFFIVSRNTLYPSSSLPPRVLSSNTVFLPPRLQWADRGRWLQERSKFTHSWER